MAKDVTVTRQRKKCHRKNVKSTREFGGGWIGSGDLVGLAGGGGSRLYRISTRKCWSYGEGKSILPKWGMSVTLASDSEEEKGRHLLPASQTTQAMALGGREAPRSSCAKVANLQLWLHLSQLKCFISRDLNLLPSLTFNSKWEKKGK